MVCTFSVESEGFGKSYTIGISRFDDGFRVAIPRVKTKRELIRGRISGRVDVVIVGEFSDSESIGPVVLSVIYVETKISLEFLVYAFGLTVSLWMIGSRRSSFDSARSIKISDELRHELRSSIAGNSFQEAKDANPMIAEECSVSQRSEFGIGRDERDSFRKAIGDDKDRVVAFGFGKRAKKVYCDVRERRRIDGNGV